MNRRHAVFAQAAAMALTAGYLGMSKAFPNRRIKVPDGYVEQMERRKRKKFLAKVEARANNLANRAENRRKRYILGFGMSEAQQVVNKMTNWQRCKFSGDVECRGPNRLECARKWASAGKMY